MFVDIKFKQMDPSEAIKAYAREKTARLEKYFRGRISVTWHLSVESQNHVAHCHVVGNNMDFVGRAATTSLYASIDEAIDKIERQIRKRKEIVKDHLHRHGHRTPSGAGSGSAAA